MTGSEVDGLRAKLLALGATLVQYSSNGAFVYEVYYLSPLTVELTSEYGRWLINLGYRGELHPASFWLAALDGRDPVRNEKTGVPDYPSSPDDIQRLGDRLDDIIRQQESLAPILTIMGDNYRRAMKEWLSGKSVTSKDLCLRPETRKDLELRKAPRNYLDTIRHYY